MYCYVYYYYKHVYRSFRNVVHVIFLIIKIVSRFIRCEQLYPSVMDKMKDKDMLVGGYFSMWKIFNILK